MYNIKYDIVCPSMTLDYIIITITITITLIDIMIKIIKNHDINKERYYKVN